MKQGVIRLADISRIESDIPIPGPLDGRLRALFSGGTGKSALRIREVREIAPEGYSLEIEADEIHVAVSGTKGLRHAVSRLEQLSSDGVIALCSVHDAPALPVRGLHLSFPAMRQVGHRQILDLIDSMARWNLNTVVFEYDARYPYRDHPAILGVDAFTREQVRELVAHAGARAIEVIPLHQSLGHLNFLLRNDAYAHLREEEEKRQQWCPLNPACYDLFRELVDDFVELHGTTRYFHIGGDETRQLGVCPRCADLAERRGKGEVYLSFISRAVEYIRHLGMTPILWDDMICRHVDVLDSLSRDVVLMYWDYWTTSDPSAMFVARPVGRGQIADRRWFDEWRGDCDSVERRMLDHFARGVDMEKDLPPDFLNRFGPYLGSGFPRQIRAFPYLEYYRDHGFRVLCAGTGSGNRSSWRGLPDFPRYGANLAAFARCAVEAGALGVMATMWYAMPFEAFFPAIVCAGQFGWNPDAHV